MEYEFVTGKRADSQLLYAEGFLYRKKKDYKNNKISYVCYDANCTARVILEGQICSHPQAEHNHAEMSALKEELVILNRMKKRCVHERLPSKTIYREEYAR